MSDVLEKFQLHKSAHSFELRRMTTLVDRQNRCVDLTPYAARIFGYDSLEQAWMKRCVDMPSPAASCHECFEKQNALVKHKQKTVTILDCHLGEDNRYRILLTDKIPVFDGSERLQGILVDSREISPSTLSKLLKTCFNSSDLFVSSQHSLRYAGRPANLSLLSKRERECLYHLVRGKSMREIGVALFISARTVETHLDNIKIKTGLSKKSDLIEFALSHSLVDFLPEMLAKREELSIILQ